MNRVHDVTTQLFQKKGIKHTLPLSEGHSNTLALFFLKKYEELKEVRSRKNCTEVQDLE